LLRIQWQTYFLALADTGMICLIIIVAILEHSLPS
jgi:hypothetical protein